METTNKIENKNDTIILCPEYTYCYELNKTGYCKNHHVFCGYQCNLRHNNCDKYHSYNNEKQKKLQIERGDDINLFRNQVYELAKNDYGMNNPYVFNYNRAREYNIYSPAQKYCKVMNHSYYYEQDIYKREDCFGKLISLIFIAVLLYTLFSIIFSVIL